MFWLLNGVFTLQKSEAYAWWKFSNEILSKFAILIWEPHVDFHNFKTPSNFEVFRSTFLEHFLQHQSIISGDGYIVHKTTFFFISLLVMASKVLWMYCKGGKKSKFISVYVGKVCVRMLDIFFRQITTFIKVCVAFVFWAPGSLMDRF